MNKQQIESRNKERQCDEWKRAEEAYCAAKALLDDPNDTCRAVAFCRAK